MNPAPSLLIVEDEQDLRDILSEELSTLNFRVLTAKDGVEALDLIKRDSQIIAVLSDIKMPQMTGLQFLEKARTLGYEMPVVFLTGNSEKALLTEALRLGAMGFIEKPFKTDDLLHTVKQALRLGLLLRGIKGEFQRLFEKYDISPDDQKKIWELQSRALAVRSEGISTDKAK